MEPRKPTAATPVFWTAWSALAAILIVSVSTQLHTNRPVWEMPSGQRLFRMGIVVSYLVSASLVILSVRRQGKPSWRTVVLSSGGVFGSFFLLLLLSAVSYSRIELVTSLVLAAVCISLPLVLKRPFQPVALIIIAVTTIGTVVWGAVVTLPPAADRRADRTIIPTTFYNLRATSFRGYFDSRVPGGGLAPVGDGYLLATGEGELHYFTRSDSGDSLQAVRLHEDVPLNTGAFLADATPNVNTIWFRTADILVQTTDTVRRLFSSHHHWDPEQDCFVVRVSVAEGSSASFLTDGGPVTWRTLYESAPCLRFKPKGNVFAGLHIGGRLVLLDDHSLLLALGDYEFDGVDAEEMLSQDPGVAYGKTVLIDLDTGTGEIYSLGHRNPQGLYAAPSGQIWLTEHGPKGGDELNRIVRGTNYGWPLVTYGAARSQLEWPLNAQQGRHLGFERPVFGWLPSIAVSNLVGIERDLFPFWRGDLVVSSLRAVSLFRMRIVDNSVALVENIPVGERVRDIIEDGEGRLVLWTDRATVIFLEPAGSAERLANSAGSGAVGGEEEGELLFAACGGCHPVADGKSHGIGPDLWGVVGRRIGAASGYNYSPALEQRAGTWTGERLATFLADPQAFAPGNLMMSEGVTNHLHRKALVKYLKTLR